MAVTEAIENYLETILILSKQTYDVHAIDICTYMGYSRPTVSIILKKMMNDGLINVNSDNHITLTDSGREVAERIYERHTIISKFLMMLGVKKETALEDACKIEHDISPKSFEALKQHYLNLSSLIKNSAEQE
ncbi:MAG: metal-dependent transcriptional regulator [Ruminococcus sp.]|nr:metal-dependent transcriptional regulator [Ruminococcus sp.]